jgi:hypothetical protein
LQRRAVRRIGHTGVAYPASPLTQPGRRRAGLRPGARVPDLDVAGPAGTTRLHEILRQGRHVLLSTAAGDLPPWTRLWPDQLVVVRAADGHAGKSVYLLRPDGYLAARGSLASPESLLGCLRLVFGSSG